MKSTIILFLFVIANLTVNARQTVAVKEGVYRTYRSFEKNDPSEAGDYQLQPFVRVNKLDQKFNDTLYRLSVNGVVNEKAFAVYKASVLYVNVEDSLYRKMEYVGRYPFATVTNKIRMPEGFVIENRTPVWKEERDEIHTYIAFVNRNGDLVAADFETMWSFLKGDNDLSKPFGKEKHVNATYKKYIVMMNERYPL